MKGVANVIINLKQSPELWEDLYSRRYPRQPPCCCKKIT
jgi:hypothetical protein